MKYAAYIMLYNGLERQEIMQKLVEEYPLATQTERQEAVETAQKEIRLNANEYEEA